MSASSNDVTGNSSVDRRSFAVSAGTVAAVAVTSGLVTNPSQVVAAADTAAPEDVAASADVDADGYITTESGMKYKVVKEGTGGIPSPGQTVKVSFNKPSTIQTQFISILMTFRLDSCFI